MDKYEEIILKCFIEKNETKEGSSLAAKLIEKEKGVELKYLYKAAQSLELQSLIKIKNFIKGEIGDSKPILGFWIELSRQGADSIKKYK